MPIDCFVSINPRIHDAINYHIGSVAIAQWNISKEGLFGLLDGPDIGTTRKISSINGFNQEYNANIVYFQKNYQQFEIQKSNLKKLWSNSKHQIHCGEIERARVQDFPRGDPIVMLFLDTQCYPLKAEVILDHMLKIKTARRETDVIFIGLNEIVRTTERKMKMLHWAAKRGGSDLYYILNNYA